MPQNTCVSRFVFWVCRHFTKSQIEQIVKELNEILANRNPEVKPRDDFKDKHPHWRQYHPDPTPPLTQSPTVKPRLNWKQLLTYLKKNRQKSKTS